MSEYQNYATHLAQLKEMDQFRTLRTVNSRKGTLIRLEGQDFLNLSSNDYLGLAENSTLKKEFETDFLPKFDPSLSALGSSSSRLLTGNSEPFVFLEKELQKLYGKPTLLFNSGYHANVGLLSALVGKGDVVFSDKLNHASLIDGMKLSGSDYFRYRHLDSDHLSKLLAKHRTRYKNAWIVTESVFSMDGDCANLPKLVELKNRHDCFLMIDEAHALGVFGTRGLGLSEVEGVLPQMDVIVGTFGKSLASMGAFAVTHSILRDYLINYSRSLIFSTALPPLNLLWSLFTLQKSVCMEQERAFLHKNSEKLRQSLLKATIETRGHSQIIPIILGENKKAVQSARFLQKHGMLVFPIRPPTVPTGTARLRLSLTANLSEEQLFTLTTLIQEAVQ